MRRLSLIRETIHELTGIREEILQESHERLRNFIEGRVAYSRIRERLQESREYFVNLVRETVVETPKQEPLDNCSSRSVELKDDGNLPSPFVPKDKLVWMNQKKMRSQSDQYSGSRAASSKIIG